MLMSLGIPYMGSKRKIAKPLMDYMLNSNPNAKYFYDLFGGGGAMSFEALKKKRFKTVHYNELNTGVVELLRKIKTDGITPEFYKWVDKKTYVKHFNDDTWYGAYLKTCWSFGNNQRKSPSYLFGADVEENKRILHEIVVNRCDVARKQFEAITGLCIDDYYLKADSVQDRRLEVMRVIKRSLGRIDMQQLEQLSRLQQLERLQQLNQLEISNKSYIDVEINTPIEETIIYLDPPYIGTAKYSKDILHDELYEYINKSPYKIYMSSYEAPFECVFELSHRSTLSASNNNKKVVEKLFCNQKELTKGRLF